jgi:hypothetical protein
MHRRQFLSLVLTSSAVAAVVAACGDDANGDRPDDTGATTTTPPGYAYPTGADDAVVRVLVAGGFTTPEYQFTVLPSTLVAGDRYSYQPAPVIEIFPGPLVAPVNRRLLTSAAMQRVLAAADEQGLLATPPTYADPPIGIADAPSTFVTLRTADATYEHVAYALFMDDVAETDPARRRLAAFVAAVGDLPALVGAGELGPEERFAPAAYAITAIRADERPVEQGLEPDVKDWPAGTGVSLASLASGGVGTCGVVTREAVGSLLDDANQITRFVEDGTQYVLAVRPVLPGDDACAS